MTLKRVLLYMSLRFFELLTTKKYFYFILCDHFSVTIFNSIVFQIEVNWATYKAQVFSIKSGLQKIQKDEKYHCFIPHEAVKCLFFFIILVIHAFNFNISTRSPCLNDIHSAQKLHVMKYISFQNL